MSDTLRLAIGCAGFLAVGTVVGFCAGCRIATECLVRILCDRAFEAGVDEDLIERVVDMLFPGEDFE